MKKSEFVSLVLALISGVALGLWYKTLDGLANNVDVRTVAVFLSITLFWKIFETAYCLIKEINKEELIVRLIFFTSVMVLLQCIIYFTVCKIFLILPPSSLTIISNKRK